jgi:molybdopterin-containing oxidoreductase family iron-sulfur binding subunit
MKTVPPPCPHPETGPRYWRSLEELADTPAFQEWLEREFPDGASELTDPVSRRHFVRIMSASFALMGLGLTTGCRRPEERILPFTKHPPGYTHGVPQYFATAMPLRGRAVPLLVKSYDGRPIKLEGNPDHPLNRRADGPAHGPTDALTQASLLNLYDPDRAQRFTYKGENVAREKALDALAAAGRAAAARQGKGLAWLSGRTSSPTQQRLVEELRRRFPEARGYVYEAVDFDIHRQAATLLFGQPVAPRFHFEHARRILALDCDFLGTEEDAWHWTGGFARGRRPMSPADPMNRLYAVEAVMTLTGANADHRLRLPAGQVFALVAAMFAELMDQSGATQTVAGASEFAAALKERAQALPAEARRWASVCLKDLAAHPRETLVVAGHRQPLAVHLLAHALNFYLEGTGRTVSWLPAPEPKEGSLQDLARALNAGEVETLLILGGNPVYDAPADLDWAATQRKAKTIFRLGYHEDETAALCDWHLPEAHYLEAWGDARTLDGTLVPVQPLIEPLFGGLTAIEVLARLAGHPVVKPYDLVRETFQALAGGDRWEEKWKRFLHDGYLADSAAPAVTPTEVAWPAAAPAVLAHRPPPAPSGQSFEVVFLRDAKLDDGRFNNNGWLQELPDPVTKLTWDNAVLLSPATAKALGVYRVQEGYQGNPKALKTRVPVVRIELDGRRIEAPVWVQPGMADHVAGLVLGYGRLRTGRVGKGAGYNAYVLRTTAAPYIATGAQLAAAGRDYELATTQNHWAMKGRPIVREANLAEYAKNPRFARAMDTPEPKSGAAPLYPNPLDELAKHAPHQWAMTIDLSACVGCAACVLACQSENNIPIVGKEQVSRNREMHWMRLDRYYVGPEDNPQVAQQPMLCQHCEAAPCENVCPVNATVHDQEGLNLMVYNRCVGTRYCSNNCPYKVRRFNFFDYNRRPLDQLYRSPLTSFNDGEWELKRWFKNRDRGSRAQDEWDLMKLARNPDVTVRMRGVMEKCTFCLQRIEQAKIAQKVRAGASGDIVVKEGAVRTACQQVCPAEAITFGNLKDPNSAVAKARAHERSYVVLDYLATKPRVTYLARIRNPNPDMPDYHDAPLSTREFLEHGGLLHEAAHAPGSAAHGPAGAGPEAAKGGSH